MERREFLEKSGKLLLAVTTLSATAPGLRPGRTQDTVFNIFGMHTAPDIGGGLNIGQTIFDTRNLGAGVLVALHPSEQLLRATETEGLQIIARAYMPRNELDEVAYGNFLDSVKDFPSVETVQPFNEVNKLKETGGEFREPEDHAYALVRAIDMGRSHNKRTLITPPDFYSDEIPWEPYMRAVLRECRRLVGSSAELNEWAELGTHPYIKNPGDDPFTNMLQLQRVAQEELHVNLEMEATEGGLHQTMERPFKRSVVADETIRVLNSIVPGQLTLRSYSFWVLSNFAQRPTEHQGINQDELLDFEEAAWRGLDGVREEYVAVAELARWAA